MDKKSGWEWWTLDNEHINHMLIAMLIAKDDQFLAEFVGHGPRKLEKWGTGGTFDLHVASPDGLVLVEFKIWSSFKNNQKPPEVFDNMKKLGATRIVYVLLTKKALDEQQGWEEEFRGQSKSMNIVDLNTLISALESTRPEAAIYEITRDYAAALKRLTPHFQGPSGDDPH